MSSRQMLSLAWVHKLLKVVTAVADVLCDVQDLPCRAQLVLWWMGSSSSRCDWELFS